jgi:hypothetical protein
MARQRQSQTHQHSKRIHRRDREMEQRELKKLKDNIIKELEADGGHYSLLSESFITKDGVSYPREYLEDNKLTRFIPEDLRGKSMDRQRRERIRNRKDG